ncbi:DUF3095 family protein [Rhizobium grahamii]|uniref:DUF3095 family protein n=1 Tax=Rhizobium grahamii TaxID=1120045 RepID=UPI0026BBD299
MDTAFQRPKASRDFAELLDTTSYTPLPDDWLIGVTDVVDSTSAIARGHYKDVNFAGASAIAALGNAFGNFDFPFVFRGDGAAFAFDPGARDTAIGVLRRGPCARSTAARPQNRLDGSQGHTRGWE